MPSKAARARWNLKNQDKMRKYRRRHYLKRTYGITPEQQEAMFAEQGHKCAICSRENSKWKHGWCVDHDHKSKKIRGVLCNDCNVLLGKFQDSIPRFQAFIDYLTPHAGPENPGM
jgi:Autographiviridae endonuclease VII